MYNTTIIACFRSPAFKNSISLVCVMLATVARSRSAYTVCDMRNMWSVQCVKVKIGFHIFLNFTQWCLEHFRFLNRATLLAIALSSVKSVISSFEIAEQCSTIEHLPRWVCGMLSIFLLEKNPTSSWQETVTGISYWVYFHRIFNVPGMGSRAPKTLTRTLNECWCNVLKVK